MPFTVFLTVSLFPLALAKTILTLMAPEVAATVFAVTVFTCALMITTAVLTVVTLGETGGGCNHQDNKHSERQNESKFFSHNQLPSRTRYFVFNALNKPERMEHVKKLSFEVSYSFSRLPPVPGAESSALLFLYLDKGE